MSKKTIPAKDRDKINKMLNFALHKSGSFNEQNNAKQLAAKKLASYGWTIEEYHSYYLVSGRSIPVPGDYYKGPLYCIYIVNVIETSIINNGIAVGKEYSLCILSHNSMLKLEDALKFAAMGMRDGANLEVGYTDLENFYANLKNKNATLRYKGSGLITKRVRQEKTKPKPSYAEGITSKQKIVRIIKNIYRYHNSLEIPQKVLIWGFIIWSGFAYLLSLFEV